MLTAIKLLHTAVWALFAACILGIFAAAGTGRFGLALVFIGVVMLTFLSKTAKKPIDLRP